MLIKSGSIKGELERMRREMDRIWDRFSRESSTHERDWNPSLDLMETEESLVAQVEVPGINPDDINISVAPEMLTVTGEKKQEPQEQEKNYHVTERSVDVHVSRIRRKLETDPSRPRWIKTVRGIGYLLARPEQA